LASSTGSAVMAELVAIAFICIAFAALGAMVSGLSKI
jgi:hypothetical protein